MRYHVCLCTHDAPPFPINMGLTTNPAGDRRTDTPTTHFPTIQHRYGPLQQRNSLHTTPKRPKGPPRDSFLRTRQRPAPSKLHRLRERNIRLQKPRDAT
ncbi:hypothetical protein EMPG_15503 [Blastomyces silverae]|uniref:Uncharacterized protein n=1 Tax=Blastomyces silverae TaxID=2060906 RepID=A0A0H1BD71_9EURO|nr:hypothetical protein EMPG_15503 [Blastomyces silverae]